MFGKITAMFMATIISITPIAASATAIPYIPPSDAYIWGYIYNALGVTALDDTITDKAQKYWDFYASLVNGVNSALYEDMKQVFHKAKTGRKIELSPAQTSVLQGMAHKAITNGIATESIPAMTTWVPYDELIQWAGINSSYVYKGTYEYWCSQNDNKYGVGKWTMCAFAANYASTMEPLYLFAYNADLKMKPLYNGTFQDRGYRVALFPNGIQQTYETQCIRFSYRYSDGARYSNYPFAYLTDGFGTTKKWKNWGAQEVTQTVTAQSQSIIDALINGVDLILTAHSQVVDGEVDDTKPIVIDLPITLPVPAVTVPDLPAVQDELGVLPLPLTEDAAATVTELQETQTASLGTTGDYQLDLTELFPFCIPFDIARVIGLFVAEPQTPVFQFAFPVGYEDGEFIIQTFTMDLAALDGVAVWVRRGMLAVFVVGLGMVTRQVFLRG